MNSLRPLAAAPSLRPVMKELQEEIDRSQERLDAFQASPPSDLEHQVFEASLQEHRCVVQAGLGAVAVAFGLAVPVLTLPGIVVGSVVLAVNLLRWRRAARRTRELEARAPANRQSLEKLQTRLDEARQALARGGNAQQVLDLAESPSSDLSETAEAVLKKRAPGTISPSGET